MGLFAEIKEAAQCVFWTLCCCVCIAIIMIVVGIGMIATVGNNAHNDHVRDFNSKTKLWNESLKSNFEKMYTPVDATHGLGVVDSFDTSKVYAVNKVETEIKDASRYGIFAMLDKDKHGLPQLPQRLYYTSKITGSNGNCGQGSINVRPVLNTNIYLKHGDISFTPYQLEHRIADSTCSHRDYNNDCDRYTYSCPSGYTLVQNNMSDPDCVRHVYYTTFVSVLKSGNNFESVDAFMTKPRYGVSQIGCLDLEIGFFSEDDPLVYYKQIGGFGMTATEQVVFGICLLLGGIAIITVIVSLLCCCVHLFTGKKREDSTKQPLIPSGTYVPPPPPPGQVIQPGYAPQPVMQPQPGYMPQPQQPGYMPQQQQLYSAAPSAPY